MSNSLAIPSDVSICSCVVELPEMASSVEELLVVVASLSPIWPSDVVVNVCSVIVPIWPWIVVLNNSYKTSIIV